MRSLFIATLAAAATASAANAQVTSSGDLTDGLFHNGSTPFNNFDRSPVNTFAYFTLTCNAGDVIDIEVNRTVNGNMDPFASVLFGNAIGLPFTDVVDFDTITGLTFAASGDDNDPAALPGPWGDPHFGFTATSAGTYTILVTNFFGNVIEQGSYQFEVRATGSTVPTPGAAALMALGSLAITRRRRA